MRLQDININPSTMKLEIDIMEQKGSFAIVICDGTIMERQRHYAPGQG